MSNEAVEIKNIGNSNSQEFLFKPRNEFESFMCETFAEMLGLYRRKNADYGDSWKAKGLKGVLVRWGDKLARLDTLVWLNAAPKVADEKAEDTIRDALTYNFMALFLLAKGIIDGSELKKG